MAQWKQIRLGTMRLRVRSLPLLSGLTIRRCHELWCRSVSCGVGCRLGSDPTLLWLWRRPVATAPIQPLAWEPPYATGAAQEIATTTTTTTKRQNKQTNKQTNKNETILVIILGDLLKTECV